MAALSGGGQKVTTRDLISAVEEGLPTTELEALKGALELTNEELAPIVGISRATLSRRRPGQRLESSESDRVLRFARLLGIASGVMGSREHGLRWLRAPQRGLGGARPLEHALTEIGAREVEALLGRIEHGVYT